MKQPFERIKEIRNQYSFEQLIEFCEKLDLDIDEVKNSYANGGKKQRNLDYNWLVGFSARLERTFNTTIEKVLKKDEKKFNLIWWIKKKFISLYSN